jgi:hypothetical protein
MGGNDVGEVAFLDVFYKERGKILWKTLYTLVRIIEQSLAEVGV